MDLAQVKVVVKAWEKAFKAKHARQPTKEDIKADGGGIADHYALYRKLSKAAAASASASGPSSSSSSRPPIPHASSSATTSSSLPSSQHSSQAGPSRSTPRHVPASDYPTTPTPPTRRRYNGSSAASARIGDLLGVDGSEGSLGAGASLKRKASAAELATSPIAAGRQGTAPRGDGSNLLNTFLTPRKSRPGPAYQGPVLDTNPSNPFSASPRRATPIKGGSTPTSSRARAEMTGVYHMGPPMLSPTKSRITSSAGTSASASNATAWDTNSPFIHATTPKKLKEVIAANSLRKVRARMDGVPGGSGADADGNPFASPSRPAGAGIFGSEITPRTKARKRLAGEMIAPTPGKAAPRKRGMARHPSSTASIEPSVSGFNAEVNGEVQGKLKGKGKRAMMDEDAEDFEAIGGAEGANELADEDDFGPSPAKGGLMRGFTSLIGEAISDDDDDNDDDNGRLLLPARRAGVGTAGMGSAGTGPVPDEGMETKRRFFGAKPGSTAARRSKLGEAALAASVVDAGRTDHFAGSANGSKRGETSKSANPLTGPSSSKDKKTVATGKATDVAGGIDDRDAVLVLSKGSLASSPAGLMDGFDEGALPVNADKAGGDEEVDEAILRLPTPPPDPELEAASQSRSQMTPTPAKLFHSQSRRKVLSLSDDEVDEFDPESDRHRRVTIVPTRRAVRRRDSDDFDIGAEVVVGDADQDEEAGEEEQGLDDAVEPVEAGDVDIDMDMDVAVTTPSGTTDSARPVTPPPDRVSASTSGSIPPHLLSLLSLHSPRKSRSSKGSGALADLRARAIFDPEARRELRALERGQEVIMPGAGSAASLRAGQANGPANGYLAEGEGDDEDERLLAMYGARSMRSLDPPSVARTSGSGTARGGRDGDQAAQDGEEEEEEQEEWKGDVEDDDWESESEGWKRTGEDMDDW